MWYVAKATIPSPSTKLLDAIESAKPSGLDGYWPRMTKKGHVVIDLRVNVAESAALCPEAWKPNPDTDRRSGGAEYLPRPGVSLAVHIFDMPPFLRSEKVGWRVEKHETSKRRLSHESCTIVADLNGLPMKPFYRTNNQKDLLRAHLTDCYFSATRLSRLQWAKGVEAGTTSTVGRLVLKRLSIALEDDRPVLRDEVLYRDEGPELANCEHARLDRLPEQWHGALQALRERVACGRAGSAFCNGHYYT